MAKAATKILVVDDDEFVRRLISTVVQKSGYEVDTARDGEEALDRLAREEYILMLLDLMMPRVDGFEVLEKIEELSISTPVIVMTAADEALLERLSRRRVLQVMRKPFDVNDLIEKIHESTASPTE